MKEIFRLLRPYGGTALLGPWASSESDALPSKAEIGGSKRRAAALPETAQALVTLFDPGPILSIGITTDGKPGLSPFAHSLPRSPMRKRCGCSSSGPRPSAMDSGLICMATRRMPRSVARRWKERRRWRTWKSSGSADPGLDTRPIGMVASLHPWWQMVDCFYRACIASSRLTLSTDRFSGRWRFPRSSGLICRGTAAIGVSTINLFMPSCRIVVGKFAHNGRVVKTINVPGAASPIGIMIGGTWPTRATCCSAAASNKVVHLLHFGVMQRQGGTTRRAAS